MLVIDSPLCKCLDGNEFVQHPKFLIYKIERVHKNYVVKEQNAKLQTDCTTLIFLCTDDGNFCLRWNPASQLYRKVEL